MLSARGHSPPAWAVQGEPGRAALWHHAAARAAAHGGPPCASRASVRERTAPWRANAPASGLPTGASNALRGGRRRADPVRDKVAVPPHERAAPGPAAGHGEVTASPIRPRVRGGSRDPPKRRARALTRPGPGSRRRLPARQATRRPRRERPTSPARGVRHRCPSTRRSSDGSPHPAAMTASRQNAGGRGSSSPGCRRRSRRASAAAGLP